MSSAASRSISANARPMASWARVGERSSTATETNVLIARRVSSKRRADHGNCISLRPAQRASRAYAIQGRGRDASAGCARASRAMFTSSTIWKSYMPAQTKSAPFSKA